MAEQTEGTIDIEASREQVMRVIADFEAYPEWSDVSSAKVIERDDAGRGTRVAYELSMMGISAAYTLAYGYREDGLSWTTVQAEGAVRDVRGEYVLQEAGGGTHVTYRVQVDLAIRVPGPLKRQGERYVVDAALARLKRRVEEG